MELDDSSRLSAPPEIEPVMDCSLVLTTLSGVTIKVSLSVAKFDRFEDLEDQVMDYLVSVTDLKVFGCSIDFLQTATSCGQRGMSSSKTRGVSHVRDHMQPGWPPHIWTNGKSILFSINSSPFVPSWHLGEPLKGSAIQESPTSNIF